MIIEKNIDNCLVVINNEKISISGDYNSNFGCFYIYNLERYKNNPNCNIQIIGMEWEYVLTKNITNWLYNIVLSGKLDNLIEEYNKKNDIL